MLLMSRTNFVSTLVLSSPVSLRYNDQSEAVSDDRLSQQADFVRIRVRNTIVEDDPTLAGSILRLAFHDAVVRSDVNNPLLGGADGSIQYEMEWSSNRGLSKPLKIVQSIYESQRVVKDRKYNEVLSFADVVALAGAAAVEAAHGPHIPIRLGRQDASSADAEYLSKPITGESSRSTITASLPSPALDSLGLRLFFGRLGLTQNEWVALMGSHGMGRHVTLTGMPKSCLKNLTRACLEDAPIRVPFVTPQSGKREITPSAPLLFSNSYYKRLLDWNNNQIEIGEIAFIPTDVALVVDDDLRSIVRRFARNEAAFEKNFVCGFQKLVDSTASTMGMY